MDREAFAALVEKAVANLPEDFRAEMDNVDVTVSDLPTPRQLRLAKLGRGSTLLGLYEGVPLSKRGVDYGMFPVLPDRITLFKMNIEAISNDGVTLSSNIRDTLIHELGHYYGMSEKQIREAGY